MDEQTPWATYGFQGLAVLAVLPLLLGAMADTFGFFLASLFQEEGDSLAAYGALPVAVVAIALMLWASRKEMRPWPMLGGAGLSVVVVAFSYVETGGLVQLPALGVPAAAMASAAWHVGLWPQDRFHWTVAPVTGVAALLAVTVVLRVLPPPGWEVEATNRPLPVAVLAAGVLALIVLASLEVARSRVPASTP